jgi:Family of unknown function (DUF5703)
LPVSDVTPPDPAQVSLGPGVVEGDWEYQPVRLPPDVSRLSASAELGLRSQFGGWELARTLLYADGTRKVWLRRKLSRMREAVAT